MYGVVVCPRCRRAKGVDLGRKTTTCPCGLEIRVVPSRVKVQVGTSRELIEAVQRANAELGGGLGIVERASAPRRRRPSRDVHQRVVALAAKAGDRAHRVRAAATELTRELEVFSYDDLRAVLLGLGIDDVEEALDELLHANVVYEPREGYYRAVAPAV
ncbi:MAG: hypothetical protein A3K65_05580 [Euryarchaeota archaeon RBG_16_68_12]|nr:MAG: hypothetical protein A3K65_05580 [Euryarchaeota archaeon RBG_16_68_12]